jgi:hypothetical protein
MDFHPVGFCGGSFSGLQVTEQCLDYHCPLPLQFPSTGYFFPCPFNMKANGNEKVPNRNRPGRQSGSYLHCFQGR